MGEKNRLFYGDNLQVLQRDVAAESVDLVYLDPPFNSNRNYNVIFGKHLRADTGDVAQIQAFGDTWVWTAATDQQYAHLISGGLPNKVADALMAMRTLLTENDAMAYLVNMAPRLVELHRVLKPTGSLYLHCDPTMSHYLKLLLDAIFGPEHFKSEIIWKRTHSHGGAKRFGPVHDVILFYAKSSEFTWNAPRVDYSEDYIRNWFTGRDEDGTPYRETLLTGSGTRNGESGKPWGDYDPTTSGRHWAIPGFMRSQMGDDIPPRAVHAALDRLSEMGRILWGAQGENVGVPMFKQYLNDIPGVALQDVWTDIPPIGAQAKERLGYPTQKPLALMERILEASSKPGDVVLDPFCGCGTTVDAAQELGRRWLGIDITYISIDLIMKRLKDRFGADIEETYEVSGIPKDKAAALALFSKDPFDFERWAVSLINGQPNEKQVGDKGIDGVARFPLGDPNKQAKQVGQILISVKGGKNIGPQFVRDLVGTVNTQKAEMGVLITMAEPTRGMHDAVNHAGSYVHPANGQSFPKVQMITIGDLLAGKKPALPLTLSPYMRATKSATAQDQPELF